MNGYQIHKDSSFLEYLKSPHKPNNSKHSGENKTGGTLAEEKMIEQVINSYTKEKNLDHVQGSIQISLRISDA